METVKVNSTSIYAVGYDHGREVLRVWFRTGKIYEYFKVPLKDYAQLLKADSKGRFYNYYIKPRFKFKKIK